jgi:hypothetical protein
MKKHKRNIAFIVLGIIFTNVCLSQITTKPTALYVGIGAGLDYGGIGIKAEAIPIKQLGIFGGAGYNFNQVGYNFGLSWKVLPGKRVVPTLTGMYGYNAVVRRYSLFNPDQLIDENTYYGFSLGAGCDIHFKKKRHKISLSVVVPFRNDAFQAKYDETKFFGLNLKPDVSKVLASIGFNFGSANPSKK